MKWNAMLRKVSTPIWVAVIGAVATVSAALVGSLPNACSEPDSGPQISVSSWNQSGGQTAQTINNVRIERPIATPTFEVVGPELLNEPLNELFVSRFLCHLVYEVPPGNVYIEVHATGIKELDVGPKLGPPPRQLTASVQFGHTGIRDGIGFTNLLTPFKELVVKIHTTAPIDPSQVKILHRID